VTDMSLESLLGVHKLPSTVTSSVTHSLLGVSLPSTLMCQLQRSKVALCTQSYKQVYCITSTMSLTTDKMETDHDE